MALCEQQSLPGISLGLSDVPLGLWVTSQGPWAGALPPVPCAGVLRQTGPQCSGYGHCLVAAPKAQLLAESQSSAHGVLLLGSSHIGHPVPGFAPSPPAPAVT